MVRKKNKMKKKEELKTNFKTFVPYDAPVIMETAPSTKHWIGLSWYLGLPHMKVGAGEDPDVPVEYVPDVDKLANAYVTNIGEDVDNDTLLVGKATTNTDGVASVVLQPEVYEDIINNGDIPEVVLQTTDENDNLVEIRNVIPDTISENTRTLISLGQKLLSSNKLLLFGKLFKLVNDSLVPLQIDSLVRISSPNSDPIYVSTGNDGYFESTVDLDDGYNSFIVIFKGDDVYSYSNEKKLFIFNDEDHKTPDFAGTCSNVFLVKGDDDEVNNIRVAGNLTLPKDEQSIINGLAVQGSWVDKTKDSSTVDPDGNFQFNLTPTNKKTGNGIVNFNKLMEFPFENKFNGKYYSAIDEIPDIPRDVTPQRWAWMNARGYVLNNVLVLEGELTEDITEIPLPVSDLFVKMGTTDEITIKTSEEGYWRFEDNEITEEERGPGYVDYKGDADWIGGYLPFILNTGDSPIPQITHSFNNLKTGEKELLLRLSDPITGAGLDKTGFTVKWDAEHDPVNGETDSHGMVSLIVPSYLNDRDVINVDFQSPDIVPGREFYQPSFAYIENLMIDNSLENTELALTFSSKTGLTTAFNGVLTSNGNLLSKKIIKLVVLNGVNKIVYAVSTDAEGEFDLPYIDSEIITCYAIFEGEEGKYNPVQSKNIKSFANQPLTDAYTGWLDVLKTGVAISSQVLGFLASETEYYPQLVAGSVHASHVRYSSDRPVTFAWGSLLSIVGTGVGIANQLLNGSVKSEQLHMKVNGSKVGFNFKKLFSIASGVTGIIAQNLLSDRKGAAPIDPVLDVATDYNTGNPSAVFRVATDSGTSVVNGTGTVVSELLQADPNETNTGEADTQPFKAKGTAVIPKGLAIFNVDDNPDDGIASPAIEVFTVMDKEEVKVVFTHGYLFGENSVGNYEPISNEVVTIVDTLGMKHQVRTEDSGYFEAYFLLKDVNPGTLTLDGGYGVVSYGFGGNDKYNMMYDEVFTDRPADNTTVFDTSIHVSSTDQGTHNLNIEIEVSAGVDKVNIKLASGAVITDYDLMVVKGVANILLPKELIGGVYGTGEIRFNGADAYNSSLAYFPISPVPNEDERAATSITNVKLEDEAGKHILSGQVTGLDKLTALNELIHIDVANAKSTSGEPIYQPMAGLLDGEGNGTFNEEITTPYEPGDEIRIDFLGNTTYKHSNKIIKI
jgi:hypothetical protein